MGGGEAVCLYAECMAVRVSIDVGIQLHTLSEVNSGPLFTFIPCKDFINTYKTIFFRRSERQRDCLPCVFVLHELHEPISPPCLASGPSARTPYGITYVT